MDAPYCPGRQVHWLKHLVVTRIVGKERSYKAADEELKAIVPTMRVAQRRIRTDTEYLANSTGAGTQGRRYLN